MTRMLLDRGADPRARSEDSGGGFVPRDIVLCNAVETGKVEIVRLLLDRGAEVNARGGMGVTPLMMASQYNHPKVVRLLLERGADATVKDDRGFDAYQFAVSGRGKDHRAVVALLKKAGATTR
jgi:ankyrin repeat protein